jgi:uncharacterized phage-like protein YoqJ
MIVGVSGHRSERILNMQFVKTQLEHAFSDLKAERVLQGMCEGVDLVAARTSYDMNIPFWAVIPWKGHKPSADISSIYLNAKVYAEKVVYVSDSMTYTGPDLFHARNRYIVDNSDTLVAVWDGTKKGGTWETIKYAKAQEKPVWLIHVGVWGAGWLP